MGEGIKVKINNYKETILPDKTNNTEKPEEAADLFSELFESSEQAATVEISDKIRDKIEEAEKLKKALRKMTEDSKKAAENRDEKIALEYKLKIIRNMLKTIQLFQSTTYTEESFGGLMSAAKRAASVARSKDPSPSKVNRALLDLRAGMSKLKAAKHEDKRGRMENLGHLGKDKDALAIKLNCNDPDSLVETTDLSAPQ